MREKSELAAQLRRSEQKVTELEGVVDRQRQAVDERDNEIARLKALLIVLEDVKAQRDALRRQLEEHQVARDELSQRLEQLLAEARELRAKDAARFEELIAARKQVDTELVVREKIIIEKDTTIKILTSKNLEMQQCINGL